MIEAPPRPRFKRGDLVRWFDYYAEGDIVRNAGKGIITEVNVIRVLNKYDHITYQVYRAEHGDTAIYGEYEIDPLIG